MSTKLNYKINKMKVGKSMNASPYKNKLTHNKQRTSTAFIPHTPAWSASWVTACIQTHTETPFTSVTVCVASDLLFVRVLGTARTSAYSQVCLTKQKNQRDQAYINKSVHYATSVTYTRGVFNIQHHIATIINPSLPEREQLHMKLTLMKD